jgi:hypothetical protein
MAKVESTDDNLYDGNLLMLSLCHRSNFTQGLYGDEFEEDFAVSALGNPSNITDSNADDGTTDFIEPPEDPSAASESEVEVVTQPIPTLDSSRPRTNADALPPKPSTTTNNGSLSYSAQVAEQFSSAYRQTPSQERGRLDAARLAQFNQSGSAGASPIDGQARPVRPSEMKDEGCVFYRSSILYPSSSLLYVKGSVCAAPRVVAPVVHIFRSTVRQLLSGSVHAYESLLHLLHAFTRCCDELRWHRASRVPSFSSISLFRILLPRMSNLPVFSAMSLCYAYAYAYPPLCISLHLCRLPLFGYYPPNILTARCLLAAYPGIQQMVLFSYPLISHPTHCPHSLQCHVHFANLC